MQGVGPGRVVAGRYTLKERRARIGDIDVWAATDDTLGREVEVTVFPTAMPNAADIVDAARRSAAIADHRLVRVLDVGSDITMSWLVEETLAETHTLAQLIENGQMPPEEARRIAGEVATALAAAAKRGVHHLHLTPHAVRLSESGNIKIAGLAIASAIEGNDEDITHAQAERQDTRSVVALMYAVMTTRWPLPNRVRGMQAAPRVGVGVAAPSELVVAVPPALDAICRSTLNQGTGPATPAQLAQQLRPWSTTRVTKVTHRSVSPADSITPTSMLPAARDGAGGQGAARPDRRAEKRAARIAAERREIEERRAQPEYLDLPEALEAGVGIDGPETRLAPGVAALPQRDGRYSKPILGAVGAAVLLATAVAIPVLWNAIPDSTSAASAEASPAPTTSAPAAPAAPATTAAPAAVSIAGVTSFDPEGDGKENETQAPRAIDGNPATAWRSEGYNDPGNVGGQKVGIGLIVQLRDASVLTGVKVTTPIAGHSLKIYANGSPSLDGATELASASATAAGEQDFRAASPVQNARYVIVLVTGLPQENDGRYRANIAEIVPY